jgi:hypothetical protein
MDENGCKHINTILENNYLQICKTCGLVIDFNAKTSHEVDLQQNNYYFINQSSRPIRFKHFYKRKHHLNELLERIQCYNNTPELTDDFLNNLISKLTTSISLTDIHKLLNYKERKSLWKIHSYFNKLPPLVIRAGHLIEIEKDFKKIDDNFCGKRLPNLNYILFKICEKHEYDYIIKYLLIDNIAYKTKRKYDIVIEPIIYR